MRPTFTDLLMTLAVLACSVILTACESAGPEFADGETTTFIEGTLEIVDTSKIHFRALTKAGTVNVEATEFTAVIGDTGLVFEDYILGVSVGLPDPADGTRCRITFSKTLEQGESFSVFAQDGIFCVTVFRSPDQPAATVVSYLLTLSGAFS